MTENSKSGDECRVGSKHAFEQGLLLERMDPSINKLMEDKARDDSEYVATE